MLNSDSNAIPANALNNPVAQQTGWHPISQTTLLFRSLRLTQSTPQTLTFKPTPLIYGFIATLVIGVVMTTVIAILALFQPSSGGFGYFVVLLGLSTTVLIASGAIYATSRLATPMSINKNTQQFTKNRGNTIIDIRSACAIQVICRIYETSDNHLVLYEANMVLTNAERVHIVAHGRLKHLRHDAARLAQFLNLQVWDATMQKT